MSKTIELSAGGQCFIIEDYESVLDGAIRNGVQIPYGCRNGACGSCKSRLLEGEVSYRRGKPDALSDAEFESEFILCCMARAESDLRIEVLDSPSLEKEDPLAGDF